jgi:4-carboxymuconolactone decarboxylase
MTRLPRKFEEFKKKYPDISDAYEKLGELVHAAGPLDEKTRALIKIGISAGAQLEGALHSHVRKALEAGVTNEAIYQAILLALPTIGFPPTMAALSWVDDILQQK